MTVIFNGRRWAELEESIIKNKVEELKRNYGIFPHLVVIMVGNDPASALYVSLKMKAAARVGIKFTAKFFEEETKASEIIKYIKKVRKDKNVHGILVQLPLPARLKKYKSRIIKTIPRKKDVDGLRGDSYIHPTAKAVFDILTQASNIGKNSSIAIVGARGMVGSALVKLLEKEKFTIVFKCNSKTKNLAGITKSADVVISATGTPNLINKDMIKEGSVLIDVGSPKGDIDFESVKKKASFVTPVPGGVGPVTIYNLLSNLLLIAEGTITNPV